MAITVLGEGANPEEAIEYWKSRIPISNKEIAALTKEAKERAFYVAGLAKLDQVNLIHNELLKALENGTTLKTFKENIAEVIKKQGWDKRRIETLFQTNMQTAYQAGRWKGVQRTKKYLPYLEYSSVLDTRTRPAHSVLHGIVFPADHPFWDSHYPPNGFNCRCTAVQLSEYQVKKEGLEVQKELPKSKDTIAKQDSHHPELTLADYLKIQDAINENDMHRQNENSYAFVLEEKDGIVCIVKVTKEKDKLYLTSMRKLSNDEIKKNETIRQIKRGQKK